MNFVFRAASVTIAALGISAGAGTVQETEWHGVAARDEIRPAFPRKPGGLLVIRADKRDGVGGPWDKTLAVRRGQHDRFRALRQVRHVAP